MDTETECGYCGEHAHTDDMTLIPWSPISGATVRVGHEGVACPDCMFELKDLRKAGKCSV